MRRVAAVFDDYDKVEELMQSLAEQGFNEHSIHVNRPDLIKLNYFPKGYDPIGGMRFSRDLAGTLPGNGRDLIGNSVSVDLELSTFPGILKSLADQEESADGSNSEYLIAVDCEDDGTGQVVQEIFETYGGEHVQISDI